MNEVYLVLSSHIVKQSRRRIVWSEWYVFDINDCFTCFGDALDRVTELRKIAESKNYDFVDYRVQSVFVH